MLPTIPKGGQKREYTGAFRPAVPKGAFTCLLQTEDLKMADRFLDLLLNIVKRLASWFGVARNRDKRPAARQSETYTE